MDNSQNVNPALPVITVLSDGCADRDEEFHSVLLTKVFSRQAEVMTVGEWAGGLDRARAGRGRDSLGIAAERVYFYGSKKW